MRKVAAPLLLPVVLGLVLAGCTAAPGGDPMPVPTPTSTPSPSATPVTLENLVPSGDPVTIVSGLDAPWSMVRLDSGSTLISERDTTMIKELGADGSVRNVGSIDLAEPNGEGGLLGLEYGDGWLYVYFSTASDNRIVRIELLGGAGDYSLGTVQDVLTGLARAGNHNGGRIRIGPDGLLYATVGDASNPNNAQEIASLNGKILRMNLDGSVPADNPWPGSLVYSMGHRNPQGLDWDADGNLWAAEFGQDTWDELNLIVPGGNYGWPIVEGIGDNPSYQNPVYQWSTDDASPSGLVYIRGTFFMAGLGGERLWAIFPSGGSVTVSEFFTGQFGRLRDVAAGPDGTLWMMTNNTDGRGSPRDGDDSVLQVGLTS